MYYASISTKCSTWPVLNWALRLKCAGLNAFCTLSSVCSHMATSATVIEPLKLDLYNLSLADLIYFMYLNLQASITEDGNQFWPVLTIIKVIGVHFRYYFNDCRLPWLQMPRCKRSEASSQLKELQGKRLLWKQTEIRFINHFRFISHWFFK